MDADASTLRMELMHEAEKQGDVHHFLSLFFRTPTAARFSSAGAARVGVGLPARPCFTVKPRQHGLEFPLPALLVLAWASPQGLVLPSSHANKARNFPCRRYSCWRQPLCKVLIHRQATPTGTGISRDGAVPCWRGPPWKALLHRQATPTGARISRVGVARVGVASLEGLVAPLSHANRSRIFPRPELLPKN